MNVRGWLYLRSKGALRPIGRTAVDVPIEKAGNMTVLRRNRRRIEINLLDCLEEAKCDIAITEPLPEYLDAPVVVERS